MSEPTFQLPDSDFESFFLELYNTCLPYASRIAYRLRDLGFDDQSAHDWTIDAILRSVGHIQSNPDACVRNWIRGFSSDDLRKIKRRAEILIDERQEVYKKLHFRHDPLTPYEAAVLIEELSCKSSL